MEVRMRCSLQPSLADSLGMVYETSSVETMPQPDTVNASIGGGVTP